MNKTAIKNFAVWARQKLIADIKYKTKMLGIDENGIAEKLPQSTADLHFFDVGTNRYTEVSGVEINQRNALVNAIREREHSFKSLKEAFDDIVEEVAYTWFNRLIAIRFMEVNNYLPSGIRVLSSVNSAKSEPDFVTTPFETDLDFTPYEQSVIYQLKDENKLDELFRMLFIKQCNKLNDILPELFEKTNDYTELLLTISFIDNNGIVYRLVNDIDEDAFNVEKEGQVEIIGWLYQYYISEKHDAIINIYKGTVKKADIPAATQLFTTDWVVRYIVDNSLGRYWIERNPGSKLAEKLDFFVTPKSGEIEYIDEKIYPADLTFFDPCMGSGHILVYAFDVLMEIYRECGYSDRDAALSIVQNNLFGIDIDKRAYQLAYFAVMMKARSYNRWLFRNNIHINLAVCEESNAVERFACGGITNDENQNIIGEYLVEVFKDSKEIGALQTVKKNDYISFTKYLQSLKQLERQLNISSVSWINDTLPKMFKFAKQAHIMSQKYSIVCTNPPYMNKMESNLKEFVVKNYKAYSGDLFSVFMYRNFGYCKAGGYSAFMTPFVWMFIKTYEALRNYIIETKSIVSLIQMEYSAFEEATVPICSFVLKNTKETSEGLYFRLSDFKGGMEVQKKKVLEAIDDKECGYFYESDQSNFSKIPGSPIAYWVSDNAIRLCEQSKVFEDYATTRAGMITGNNNLFIRIWHEIDNCKLGLHSHSRQEAMNSRKKWFPYNKGGDYRKWYGNNDYVVNWENDGFVMRNYKDFSGKIPAHAFNLEYIFKENVTWSSLSSYKFAARYTDYGFLYDASGSFADIKKENIYYTLAFLCSEIAFFYLSAINPTLNFQKGNISNLPFILNQIQKEKIDYITNQNIKLSKTDWDSYETSWDFKCLPLVNLSRGLWDATRVNAAIESYYGGYPKADSPLELCYLLWKGECSERFKRLKANEEELNRIFIDIYGLRDELTPEVADRDVTVHYVVDSKDDIPESLKGSNYVRTKRDEIVSLISYAVGCMFGRYSLDREGLVYAGGDFSDRWSVISGQYAPDEDNCIPITDEQYFEDDIVGRFVEFIETVYGKDTLEENLKFIASALGGKGNSSREVIRSYFLKDFIKDHIKTYKKRPIYWMFDSGRQNGFKALVYMHRWNADTIGNVRVEYLHRVQNIYEREISRMQEITDSGADSREIGRASKRREKLLKQLKETRDYDEKIAHLALSRIDIDLDDGVKVNYEKVQTGKDGKKMQILTKI